LAFEAQFQPHFSSYSAILTYTVNLKLNCLQICKWTRWICFDYFLIKQCIFLSANYLYFPGYSFKILIIADSGLLGC
jgi:hypothetical protein